MLKRETLKKVIQHFPPILVATISILDLFGAFDGIMWLRERLPAAVLLVSATILELAIWHREKLEKLTASFEETSANATSRLESDIKGLKDEINKDLLEKLNEKKSQLDQRVTRVIGPYMDEQIAYLAGIFNHGSFELIGSEKFARFYQDTLNAYQPAQFFSTSIPAKQFFWARRRIIAAIWEFLRNKKSGMKRVFFLDSSQQLEDPEVNLILRCQKEIGVDVYTVLKKDAAQEWPTCFMVDSEARIGWELDVDADARTIKRARLKWRTTETEDLMKRFQQIEAAESLRQFTGGIHPDPNTSGREPYDEQKFKEYEWRQWQEINTVDGYVKYFGGLMQETAATLLSAVLANSSCVGVRFLDIATGPGYLAAAAAERGAKVTAVDFSDAMIGRAREIRPDIDFRVGEAENLSQFTDGSFDAAGINFGIMHFACPDLALKEAHRVLREGGRFGFTVWNRDETGGIGVVMRALEALEDPMLAPPLGPPFFRFSNTSECRRALVAAGFRDSKIRIYEKHELNWKIQSGDEIFNAFLTGTARIGGRLRSQEPWALELIRELVTLRGNEYRNQGFLRLPFFVVSAEKG